MCNGDVNASPCGYCGRGMTGGSGTNGLIRVDKHVQLGRRSVAQAYADNLARLRNELSTLTASQPAFAPFGEDTLAYVDESGSLRIFDQTQSPVVARSFARWLLEVFGEESV